MKRIMIAMLAFVSATTAMAQSRIADVAKFNVETFDFGRIKQSVPATATFVITNTSSAPIIIEQANPTCGCTIADYTKSPIAPGQTGTIKATYNAAAAGSIHKSITVKLAGIDELKSLSLAGEVVAADAPQTGANLQPVQQVAAPAAQAQMATPAKVKITQTDGTVTKKKKKATKTKTKIAVPQ